MTDVRKKIAVVLFNLGGPDSPEAVRPFLYNLFNDPAILGLPKYPRRLLAWFISTRRHKTAQVIYGHMGGKSPILENTQAQARALEKSLDASFDARCFVVMRYWHPFVDGAAKAVKDFNPDEIVLLPLYPQYSTTTTASSFKSWFEAAKSAELNCREHAICCYPDQTGFINTLAETAKSAYVRASGAEAAEKNVRILFSAHGLPEKIVKAGDPYAMQCERTVASLVNSMNISDLDYQLCYQSRVGPLKWIGPSTDSEIRRAGQTGTSLVIVPIAFVSEHSETLVELDIEYRHLAEKSGVPFYERVSTVGASQQFIEGLADLTRGALQNKRDCVSASGGRLCAGSFSGCPVSFSNE